MTLPLRVAVSDSDISAVGATLYLGSLFHGLEDVYERWRFWTGDVSQHNVNHPAPDGTSKVVRTVRYGPDFSQIEFIDHVATERLERYVLEKVMSLTRETEEIPSLIEAGPAALAPDNYISKDEAFFAEALSSILHFDVLVDANPYGGLTFREWLRGYSWLQRRCVNAAAPIEYISRQVALRELMELGITEKSADTVLKQISMRKGRTDLFDTPLIAVADDGYIYHSNLFDTSNIARIVLARLASLSVAIEPKGKSFEREVIGFLREKGFHAKGIEFKQDGQDFEYDAVFVWDRVLFIFECKSYSLPLQHPMQLHWYVQKMNKAVRQVQRLAAAAGQYRQLVATRLGVEASWTSIVPCVLNSLPWSAGQYSDGVMILDYSCVRRFFNERTIHIKIPSAVGDLQILARHHVKELWPETGPTVTHFLDEMKLPWQVKSLASGFEVREIATPLSDDLIFQNAVIAHAVPDLSRSFAAIGVADPTSAIMSIRKDLAALREGLAKPKHQPAKGSGAKRTKKKRHVRRKRKRNR